MLSITVIEYIGFEGNYGKKDRKAVGVDYGL